jgi:hypothetical protein
MTIQTNASCRRDRDIARGDVRIPVHVNFESPKARPVTWHQLTYGQGNKGKRVIGGDMGFAEMIILMFELSAVLPALSAATKNSPHHVTI